MRPLREAHRTGLHSLADVTVLLQRIRRAHPTAGLYEAADLQWSWRTPRVTDDLPQLFWLDDLGRPEAAAIATAGDDRIELAPIVMPDVAPDRVAHVVARGLAHVGGSGFDVVTVEVDRADDVLRDVLVGHGFAPGDDGVVEAWLAAEARPDVSPLPEGYRSSSRLDTMARPHHMIHAGRNHPDVEPRLRQTSLYRPDLDLVVHDRHGEVAAYGLFWYDPETATGLVEPMRTEDDHQRRGLARHILTTGIDRLAAAGAERIKICFEPDNPASRGLYLDVGFAPDRRTVVFSRSPVTGGPPGRGGAAAG
jgi:GNAT superfamily N-acetyltransferase